MTRRDFLRISGAGVVGAGLLGVYGCGGGGDPGGVEVNWASWANPGEAQRFQEFTQQFNQDHPDINLKFTPTPDFDQYHPKILTQLNGGTAPDAFYTGESFISKFIDNETIMELNSYLEGPKSESRPDMFFDGLWGAARAEDGTIYGLPVDCNPLVIWFNKGVLREAGINDMPSDLYERGEWKWDTFRSLCEKVSSRGQKNGYMLDEGNLNYYSWVTCNGGTVYEGDRFVANEDPKSVETFQFLYDNIKAGNFSYAGTLPTGQGSDAQFMSSQTAFAMAGRWWLPIFKQNENLEFDVVPLPTNTDNDMEPVGIPTAYMVMNANTKASKKTFEFVTNFVSPEGQVFRLEAAGNAVPSVSGADDVVLKDAVLEGARYFLDVREIGYAFPKPEGRVPGLTEDMQDVTEKRLWLKDGDGNVQDTLDELAELANGRIQEQGG